MDECKTPKTVLTYNTIISACARAKEVGMAKNLLSKMRKDGIKPSVVTYNSLISACASTGRFKDAMSILDQCNRDPHCSPDIYTYTNAIRACAKSRNTNRALSLYEVVKHKKLPLDSYFYAAVIEACAKARMWKKALELLQEMEDEGIAPTDVIYGVTVTACGNGGQWRKALGLLELMREKKMRINLYVYNAAITACAKAAKRHSKQRQDESGKLSLRTMELLDQMNADGIRPDGFTFSSAISCCGAEGQWEEALGLMDKMKKGGPRTRPNKIAYTAAIAACGRSGEHERALALFQEMKKSGLEPDRVSYNALFSALRVSGQPESASELWDEMCGKGNFTAAPKASAVAGGRATPDIITLTDVIATLKENNKRVDDVFAEAVKLGVVLPAPEESLDRFWEVDLSSMSFPVARAACRYVLRRTVAAVRDGQETEDLSFITGVGTTAPKRGGKQRPAPSTNDRKSSSKRDFLQEVLRDDFDPPIQSLIPKYAQGTVQIDKSVLQAWMQRQQTFPDL